MSEDATLQATLRLAEEVLAVLSEQGVDAVLIGAVALAVHGYPRDTTDLDARRGPLPPDRLQAVRGGPKSALDILEMLDRNPDIDLERLRALCSQYRLDRALEGVLALRDGP